MLPCASHATSVGRLKTSCGAPAPGGPPRTAALAAAGRRGFWIFSGFRPSRNATRPCASNFITIEDIFVDDPEVVLRIDADLRGEQKAVDALADLAREFARAIELEQPRATVHERTR